MESSLGMASPGAPFQQTTTMEIVIRLCGTTEKRAGYSVPASIVLVRRVLTQLAWFS